MSMCGLNHCCLSACAPRDIRQKPRSKSQSPTCMKIFLSLSKKGPLPKFFKCETNNDQDKNSLIINIRCNTKLELFIPHLNF